MSDIKSLKFPVQIWAQKSQVCEAFFPNIGEYFLPSRLPLNIEGAISDAVRARLQAVPWDKEVYPITFLGNPWIDIQQAPILIAISPLDEKYDEMLAKAEQAMSQPRLVYVSIVSVDLDLISALRLLERWGYFDGSLF